MSVAVVITTSSPVANGSIKDVEEPLMYMCFDFSNQAPTRERRQANPLVKSLAHALHAVPGKLLRMSFYSLTTRTRNVVATLSSQFAINFHNYCVCRQGTYPIH